MSITGIIRYLRRKQTRVEKILWEELRKRRLGGRKFLRQHPVLFMSNGEGRFFVADFYCAEYRLIVEIDGEIHERQRDHDRMRDCMMKELGYTVIRFRNEAIENSLEEVLDELKKRIDSPPSLSKIERGDVDPELSEGETGG